LYLTDNCAWAGKGHSLNFHLNLSKSEKSHGTAPGLSEGGSNGECQESRILPAPSEIGRSQCEQKRHLIAFSSSFRPSGRRNRP
jgi:hypothetical protein